MTPALLRPMLATPSTVAEVVGDAWAHEFKWDGVRVLAAGDGRRLQLRSRAGNDVTTAYPELQPLAAAVGATVLLDGEVVAVDARGVPSFAALQPRMHLRDPARVRAAMATVPVTLIVFDVLLVDGAWLLDRPYDERRARLRSLDLDGGHWTVPPAASDLTTALRTAEERGLEGVVAKRRTSPYRPGERSPDWRKLRLLHEQEFVVGGIRPGRGARRGTFGALLVGTHDPAGDLRYAGAVGSGYTDREATRLAGELAARVRAVPPFVDPPPERDLVWVAPELVVQVRFREWTPDGRLRQPVYRGQRVDRDPATVVREP